MQTSHVDMDRLLRLRLAVARFGEMDSLRWWNTRGLLGQIGEKALSRGFPKTHYFAQAKVVFTVAAERCREVFDLPHSVTLWNLPAEIEDRFESNWPVWIEHAADWSPFFAELASPKSGDHSKKCVASGWPTMRSSKRPASSDVRQRTALYQFLSKLA